MSVYDPVAVELTDDERHLLSWGLIEWGGPARCTEELALAMGFTSVADIFDEGYRIADDIRVGKPLPRVDWARALLATEIVFASEVVGSGRDWESTAGMDDVKSIGLLRSVQRKLPWHGVFGTVFGTRPDRPV